MIQTKHIGRDVQNLGGAGEGTGIRLDWVDNAALPPNCNMCATITLPPGATVSDHTHEGEAEIYRILSGKGMYNDNGVQTEVKPGDVTLCPSGEKHGLVNNGDEPLVFDAIIIGG